MIITPNRFSTNINTQRTEYRNSIKNDQVNFKGTSFDKMLKDGVIPFVKRNSKGKLAYQNLGGTVKSLWGKAYDNCKPLEKGSNALLGGIAGLAPVKGLCKWGANHHDTLSLGLKIGQSAAINFAFIYKLSKNKDMEERKKRHPIVMNILTFVIPSTINVVGTKALKSGVKKLQGIATDVMTQQKADPKYIKDVTQGISATQVFIMGAIVYKLLASLISMPIADKVVKKWNDKDDTKIAKSKGMTLEEYRAQQKAEKAAKKAKKVETKKS